MIDTQTIRTRILHLALQGKLVPQNSSDDSAIDLVSALCKKIKGQSFQNNISQQEIPYDIPDSWVWCHLSDIGTTNIGLTYHPEDVSANGTIVARSSNIVNNKMDYTDLVKVTCPIRDNQFLHTHDILICARNGSKALVGKCAIFEGSPKTVAFGAFMAVFRTPLYRFIYYYFNSQVFKRNFFNDESKQINQVTQNILKKSLIPIPPIQEQERITRKIEQAFSVLDTIDELQAQYADNLTALKSKLIDAAIQGKLTEQLPEDGTAEELIDRIKIEKEALISSRKIPKEKALPKINSGDIPFDIPDNWNWVRVQDVATYITDYVANGSFATLKANTKTYKEKNYALFVRTMDLSADFKDDCSYIDKKSYDFLKKSRLFGGELILPNIGASIGKAFIMPNLGMPMSLAPNSIMLKFTEPIINSYFSFIIKSSYGYKLLNKTQGGSATAKFSKTDLRSLIVPIPPLSEIKRIVQKLEEILPLCEKN